ncbi:31757_t:CDS:2 [Gigaspora margarita]|uniref:31757_t:CDS:1 n=1 Tax=Gigaspora margarita TaxID=4874 RepID=A0ABN7VVH9_GIGMA|nr:31757_t:CDS:2 [Gigaspora margarita]
MTNSNKQTLIPIISHELAEIDSITPTERKKDYKVIPQETTTPKTTPKITVPITTTQKWHLVT